MRIKSLVANSSGLGKLTRNLTFLTCLTTLSCSVIAGPQEQARRMHHRITGLDATQEVRDQMATLIAAGDPVGAALLATENENFYDSFLPTWIKPWSNEEGSVKVPLNDFVATIIGIVRDEADFRTVLTGDVVYTANDANLEIEPYAVNSSEHYEELEQAVGQGEISLKDALSSSLQSGLSDGILPADATAGVLTTLASARAYFVAGTNRAQFSFTLQNFMCRDMESIGDVSGPTDSVRQDVERNPGGDSNLFMTYCVKCHSQMDANAGAFAYYDYDEENDVIVYSEGEVRPKYFLNANAFPEGFVTTNDSWYNPMRLGTNMTMEFDANLEGKGTGLKSWGEEIANSNEFASCQVKKAFEATCLTPPTSGMDLVEVERITNVFKASGYNMKRVFAETAVYCMGE